MAQRLRRAGQRHCRRRLPRQDRQRATGDEGREQHSPGHGPLTQVALAGGDRQEGSRYGRSTSTRDFDRT